MSQNVSNTANHLFRFVERKKLSRRLKKASSDQEKEEVEQKLCYIDYYPVNIKYIAIFPSANAGDKKDDQKNVKNDEKNAVKEAEKDSVLSSHLIMQKIIEMRKAGILVEGFTWRWNQSEDCEESKEEKKIVDAAKPETDDFFLQ